MPAHRGLAVQDAVKLWESGLDAEVAFWDEWIRTRGSEWPQEYARRTDPKSPLQDFIAEVLTRAGKAEHQVLDLGAGPMSSLGKVLPGHKIHITAVDPLADVYDHLMAKHGVTPLVRTKWCHGELLSKRFRRGVFDLVWAWNCLDHSYNPLECIEQALAVTRIGGSVLLLHNENEAERERYEGLHQWNFSERNGRAYLWGTRGFHDLTRHFATIADVRTTRNDIAVQIVFSKRAEELPLRAKVSARLGKEAHQLLPLWKLTRLRFGAP